MFANGLLHIDDLRRHRLEFVLEDIVRVDSLEKCFLGNLNSRLNHPLHGSRFVVDDLDGLAYVDHMTVHHYGNRAIAYYFESIILLDDHHLLIAIAILGLA